jgi:hemolysin III
MHYDGEKFNTATHLGGLSLALIGTSLLMDKAVSASNDRVLPSFAIFAASMVILYAASSLYHSARGAAKEFWAKVDHCAIYLLIAGTYTPLTLVTLHGATGWTLFGVVWTLAVLGIGKELGLGRGSAPPLALYVSMGWVGLLAAIPLLQRLPGLGWVWLLLGALLYTLGIPFYVMGKRWRHAHGIWHLFVLGGTTSHFFTILNFVA